jgi:enoyl-[acyl-carrier protein] reductase II
MDNMAGIPALYFGGDMDAAISLFRQVAGRIDEIKFAKQIVEGTMLKFHEVIQGLSRTYANG